MRRKDREITDTAVIHDVIRHNNSAVMSLIDHDKPYGVMLNYAPLFQDGTVSLIFHGATEGRKVDCLRHNPAASIFINDHGVEKVLLKGEKPSGQSTTQYRSVILSGTVRLIDDIAEKRKLAALFLGHFGSHGIDMPPDQALAATQFFLFTADEMTGKQNMTDNGD